MKKVRSTKHLEDQSVHKERSKSSTSSSSGEPTLLVSRDTQLLVNTIKRVMRNQGFQYEDLAKVLDLSLPSVKRIMSQGDLTFERLERIAAWLGLGVFQLLSLAQQGGAQWYEFTEVQDRFFASHPECFYFFIMIVVGKPVDELMKKYNLSREQVEKMFRKMENVDLVKISPSGQARVVSRGPYNWRKGGAMEKKFFASFVSGIEQHFARAITGFDDPRDRRTDFFFRPYEYYLSEESFAELTADMRQLFIKYRSRVAFEAATVPHDQLVPVSGIMAVAQFNSWEEVLLENKKFPTL